jgi:outer membrane receptor protein involved in Fe transport
MSLGAAHKSRLVVLLQWLRSASVALLLSVSLAAVLTATARAESQRSIIGIVFDSTSGTPVQDALVRITGTAFSARTGPAGDFEIISVPAGSWRLQVDRYGYHPITPQIIEVIEGFERHVRIGLAPDPIILAPSVVEESSVVAAPATGVRRYSRRQIQQAGHHTLAEALAAIPGVRVYGGSETPGGTRVSVGGASPERVAVLLDGLPLASGSDGTVNLDIIPLAAIKAIEVTPGSQSAGSGDAAIGGSVNLRTQQNALAGHQDLGISAGSFGLYRGTLNSGLRLGRYAAEAVLETSGRGNHFTYPDGDSIAVRNGVGAEAWRGFLGISPAGTPSVSASGFFYRSTVGAPGALEQLYPGATNQNERLRAQCSWDWLRRASLSVGTALWLEQGDDRLRSTKPIMNDAESLERFLGARLNTALTLPACGGLMEIEVRSRRLEGKDHQRPDKSFGIRDRLEYSLRSTAKRVVSIRRAAASLTLSAALDGDNRFAPVCSPRIDLGCWNVHGLHGRVGWGRSFRRPTLTSLFWKADAFAVGNPDLQPERASEWDVAAGLRRAGCSLESRYFERRIRDIISWERDFMGRFKPKNVARAFIVGREDQLSLALFRNQLTLAYTHVFTGAYDQSGELNHDGMVLVMSPRHTHDLSADAAIGRFSGRFSGRWVSSRELRRDNRGGKQLAPYKLFDGFIRLAIRRANPSMQFGVRVDNITNERVDLLERYPSPGRTWLIETVFTL